MMKNVSKARIEMSRTVTYVLIAQDNIQFSILNLQLQL